VRSPDCSAFTQIDMLAVIFIVLLLGLWVGASQVGEAGRSTRCQSNLAALGNALHSYAKDNNNALPAAGIDLDKTQTSWDGKLFAYLKPALAKSNGAYEQRMLQEAVARISSAPRTRRPTGNATQLRHVRHDMQPENWPPGPGNATASGWYGIRRASTGCWTTRSGGWRPPIRTRSPQ